MKKGFDHPKYIEKQSRYILERVHKYDKLYLEFGGKLMADLHAKRVLPGFDPDAKIKLLHHLSDQLEVIVERGLEPAALDAVRAGTAL